MHSIKTNRVVQSIKIYICQREKSSSLLLASINYDECIWYWHTLPESEAWAHFYGLQKMLMKYLQFCTPTLLCLLLILRCFPSPDVYIIWLWYHLKQKVLLISRVYRMPRSFLSSVNKKNHFQRPLVRNVILMFTDLLELFKCPYQ